METVVVDRGQALADEIKAACDDAERSRAFISIQLDPKQPWPGWPHEVASAWVARKPMVLRNYQDGHGASLLVGRALRKHLRDVYRPRKGAKPGPKPKEPQKGLVVPQALSDALDGATWDAMRKMGALTDATAIRQAVKIPADTDVDGGDIPTVIRSAGTVTGEAMAARYTSIRGDLYWSDVRNSLELWLRARPEFVDEFNEWDGHRAWEEGGEWLSVPGGRVEHNPIVHVRSTAFRRALDIIRAWDRDGTVSLDALYDSRGDEGVAEARRPKPERAQHPKTKTHYAWGLRDDVDCYNFPVTGTPSTKRVKALMERWSGTLELLADM